MKHPQKLFLLVFLGFLLLSCFLFTFFSLDHLQFLTNEKLEPRPITDVICEIEGEKGKALTLPHTLTGLSPRTSVILTTEIEAQPGESIFIKSVFAPMRLYINGIVFYEYGQRNSYPAYMNDPPTGLALISLPEEGGTLSLQVEYESLTQRDTLSLPVFYIGKQAPLLDRLLSTDGLHFLFSLILIFLGTIMILVSLVFVRKTPSGSSFLWLGLFSFSAGVWILGECDFTPWVFPYPSLLYAMTYMGLFCVAIPSLQFGLIILHPRNKLPIKIMLWLHYFSVIVAVVLQLTGAMDFTKSLFWFHIITPLAFVTFAICFVWEGIHHHNPSAKRFAPAILLLALSIVLELMNYWLHLTNTITLFFQLGVLTFVISLGIISGYFVRESLYTAAEKKRLEYEMTWMEQQLSLQRLQYQKMAEDEEQLKNLRHDLHHHLAVVRSLNGEKEKLDNYLDRLTIQIPSDKRIHLCENYAVNAIAAHYYTMAQQEKIKLDLSLTIPRELSSVVETDLCVLVGNLMENAIEACIRMSQENSFIHMSSSLQYGVLTLTVDNSFTGNIRKHGNIFLSSKRQGAGVGISSIIAVAKKYNGGTRFEESGGVFQASVYLKIHNQDNNK